MFEARAATKDDGGGEKDGRAARDHRERDRLDLALERRSGSVRPAPIVVLIDAGRHDRLS